MRDRNKGISYFIIAASIYVATAFEDEKSFKICNVLGGLDITRLVSSNTRNFFKGAIEDVELIREVVSESATNGGITGGLSDLAQMNATLDWSDRNLTDGTRTVGAGLGYTDDRKNRRMERFISLAQNEPFIGDKAHDMGIVDTVSNIFPWILDRKSKEKHWWLSHQNGKSQGTMKEPFLFGSLYTAAWIGSYGEAWAYYPPMHVYGHPLTFGDILGGSYDSHEEEFVKPNLPENNPKRKAFFTTPYPDSAVPGLSLLTAMAPVYYSGIFKGVSYYDTYIGSTGVDIAVSSVSSLLDVLEKLTKHSFGMLVDSNFNTIVISQSIVEKIYPKRTGFEEERVTIDKSDGSIVDDRRNMTYLVSDTIIQPLSNLTNANWSSLLSSVNKLNPGERGYSNLDIKLTGEKDPTSFYVMYERWEYVADWVLLVFAPVFEVDNSISVDLQASSEGRVNEISLEAVKGRILYTEVNIVNNGTLDVNIVPKTKPKWIGINLPMNEEHVLKSKETLNIKFDVNSENIGTSTDLISFLVQDNNYPDCFHKDNLNIPISLKVVPQNCDQPNTVADLEGNCVCANQHVPVGGKCVTLKVMVPAIVIPVVFLIIGAIFVYFNYKMKKEDSIWVVNPSDLYFKVPPVVLGRGTFGLVLLAEYRGTHVAVKRVIPPRDQNEYKTDLGQEDSGEYDYEGQKEPEEYATESAAIEGRSSSRKFSLDIISRSASIDEGRSSSRKFSLDTISRSASIDTLVTNSNMDRESVIFDLSSEKKQNLTEINRRRSSDLSCSGLPEGKEGVSIVKHKSSVKGKPKARHTSSVLFDFDPKEKKDNVKDTNGNMLSNLETSTATSSALKSGSTISGTFNGLLSGSLNYNDSTGSNKSREFFSVKNMFGRKEDEYSRLKADFILEMRHLSKLRHPCITSEFILLDDYLYYLLTFCLLITSFSDF